MDMVQSRDGKGHFTGELVPDAELAAKLAEEDERGEAAARVCETLGLTTDMIGLNKRRGRWSFGCETKTALMAMMAGIAYGTKNAADTKKVASAILDASEAAGIADDLLKARSKKLISSAA